MSRLLPLVISSFKVESNYQFTTLVQRGYFDAGSKDDWTATGGYYSIYSLPKNHPYHEVALEAAERKLRGDVPWDTKAFSNGLCHPIKLKKKK